MPADGPAPGLVALPAEPTGPADALPAEGVAAAARLGHSSGRRIVGLVGQYTVLVVLAAVVLAPLAYSVIQALSPPLSYAQEGTPLHPVSVDWKDRTWFTGGALSVAARSVVLVLVVAWLQLRVGGGGVRHLAPLARPRQLVAVASGVVALALLSGLVIGALHDRSSSTAAWFAGSMAVVAVTQFVGFQSGDRRVWVAALYAALVGVALLVSVVVVVGAQIWSDAWDEGDGLGGAMARSFVIATLIVVCQLATSVLAAYAFAFLRFPLKNLVFAFFVATMLLPLEVTLLANVQTIRELEWVNSTQALVLPFAATALGTFLIRQGFRGLPPEIHDATRLDGYGHLAFMWRFAVPLTRPVIASFTVIAALGAWNQYLWPQAVIDQAASQTAQIRLRTVSAADPAQANVAVAAALMVAIPVVLLLVAFSRQIIRGLTAGAVKG